VLVRVARRGTSEAVTKPTLPERLKFAAGAALATVVIGINIAAEGVAAAVSRPLYWWNAREVKKEALLHAATRPYLWRFTCRCEGCGRTAVTADCTAYSMLELEQFMSWHWRCDAAMVCRIEGIGQR
jgi:hypothetical protein